MFNMDIDYSVYLVTDQFDFSENEFLEIIKDAIIGGVKIVQLREKNSSTRVFYNIAVKVKEITDEYGAILIINDRLDITQAIDCDGVHLGQSDMPCSIARKILGSDKIIGISASSYKEALQAQEDGADYIGVGAIEYTPTKKDATIVPREDLEKIKENITIPKVAIGGINKHNAKEIVDNYNFDGVAIVSAIMKSDNPRISSSNLLELVKGK